LCFLGGEVIAGLDAKRPVGATHACHLRGPAAAPHAADSYLAYSAAVDREEAAARDLQRLSDLTQPCQDRLAQSE
jgi:hypothetical protein